MSVVEIVQGLVKVEERVSGIRKAFEYAPNALNLTPCFLNVISDGDVLTPRMGQGVRETTHFIEAQALIALQADLADAEKVARPLIQNFKAAVDQDKTLGGTANVLSADVTRYRYGPIALTNAAGEEVRYMGVVFTVQVIELEVGTTYGSTGPSVV